MYEQAIPAVIAGVSSVVVIVLTILGQWVSRNDRQTALQEAELLEKLPRGESRDRLRRVLDDRIKYWELKSKGMLTNRALNAVTIGIVLILLGAASNLAVGAQYDQLKTLVGAMLAAAALTGIAMLTVGVCTFVIIALRDACRWYSSRLNRTKT